MDGDAEPQFGPLSADAKPVKPLVVSAGGILKFPTESAVLFNSRRPVTIRPLTPRLIGRIFGLALAEPTLNRKQTRTAIMKFAWSLRVRRAPVGQRQPINGRDILAEVATRKGVWESGRNIFSQSPVARFPVAQAIDGFPRLLYVRVSSGDSPFFVPTELSPL